MQEHTCLCEQDPRVARDVSADTCREHTVLALRPEQTMDAVTVTNDNYYYYTNISSNLIY